MFISKFNAGESPKEKRKKPLSYLSRKRKGRSFRRRKWTCAFLHWPTLTRRIHINKGEEW